MTVKQVGRTTTSVTINVSGITEGNRQTYIWMPSTILNSSKGSWIPLGEAATLGYITKIETDYEDNNGDITVWLPSKYYKEYKVVQFEVHNVDTSSGDTYIFLNTILGFKYDGIGTKSPGADIDITVNDMKAINKFGCYIGAWIGGDDGWHYYLDDVGVGDKIYADYLNTPAQHILDAALANSQYLTGGYYKYVYDCAKNVADNVKSGADFKASYFNNIYTAINAFNMSYTV